MMSILKEIRDSQATQCTKNDLVEYGKTINKQFSEVDKRISANASTINSMESRMVSIEASLEISKHEAELMKQNAISRNLSVMGIPATANEDLKSIALKAKMSKDLRLNDVVKSNPTNDNPLVFVKNHVTPFFGKLMAEERKALKEKKIHSVWLARHGCHLRLEENGKDFIYRSVTELNGIISSRHQQSENHKKRSRSDDSGASPGTSQKPKRVN